MSGSPDRPKWIPVQKMVPQSSIGQTLISQIPTLGERLRPETTFQQPLRPNTSFVTKFGLSTYSDVLSSSPEFVAATIKPYTLYRVNEYLQDLLVLPHSRLVAAAYIEHELPVIKEHEQEIREKVEEALEMVENSRLVEVLVLRFGLYDGITRIYADISRQVGIPDYMVKSDLGRGSKALKERATDLRGLQVLSEDSVGYKVFGAHLKRELPELDLYSFNWLEGLHLSTRGRAELERFAFYWGSNSLIELNYNHLPDWLREEVVSALKKRAQEVAERIRKYEEMQARDAARAVQAKREYEQRVAKKIAEGKPLLFPSLELGSETLKALFGISIYDLDLSTRPYNALIRRGIKTVGDVLCHTEEELMRPSFRNLGVKSLAEIKEKVLLLIVQMKKASEA